MERALWSLAVAAAALWWMLQEPSAAGWLALKALPAALMAWMLWRSGPSVPERPWITAALVLDGAGDAALELDLLAGMALFLAGHLVWFTLFWRRHRSAEQMRGGDRLRLGLLGIAGASLLALLAPHLSTPFRVAVPLYAGALLAMAGAAQLVRRGRPWVPLGALAFVVSDALLALRLFARIPVGDKLVWPLYVAALLAMAGGWRYGPEEPPDPGDEP